MSKPDKTATFLALALLGLGFYAAYRARNMLRARR
jgi:hypothetical protein